MIHKVEFYEKLKKIPKCELHLHCEGVISKKTVLDLFKISNPDEEYDSQKIDDLFDFNNLSEFIQIFLAIQRAFNNPKDFDCLFEDLRSYLLDNGIVYSEIYISPTSFVRNGLDFYAIMERVIKKIRDIKKKNSIDLKMIIDVSRTFGIPNARNNLNMILDLKKIYKEIIGIGLGGDEVKGPAKNFKEVFDVAKENNLHLVAHAGESVDYHSVVDTINYLNVERIGHGISSIFSKETMDMLKEKKVTLEICPTSNIFTKHYFKTIEEHPLKKFFDYGIQVTLNTDDPTFFDINLLDEYYNAYSKLNFSLDEIKELIKNGFRYSFLSEKDKNKYLESVDKQWKEVFG